VFIGNDSGPAHIACSVGTPVVTVIHHSLDGDPAHRSSPTRFGPWGVPHRVLRPAHSMSPCMGVCTDAEAHCITAVSAEDVTAAALDLLALDR
jgi:ADP-heptose:LPS heptosyltransferase